MEKYKMEYILRGEEGINGLRIIPRVPNRQQDKTNKPVLPEPVKEVEALRYDDISGLPKQYVKTEGDLRNYNSDGRSTEDYCITGEGRPTMIIREVQTSIDGMKKYALLDLPEDETKKKPKFISKKKAEKEAKKAVTYNVRYVYSEGIDIGKMAEDEEYAKAVISLLGEKRLQQKQIASYNLGQDIVYLGTITKQTNGYVKSGIRDYVAAVTGIAFKLENLKKQAEETYKTKNAPEEKRTMKEKAQMVIAGLNSEEKQYVIWAIMNDVGIAQTAEMTSKAIDMIREDIKEQKPQEQNKNDQEYYEW